jgi:3'-phosphoadenosine 5'-phosphosulfate sulfotransferase (PAPS reductase)/FAD synthetase
MMMRLQKHNFQWEDEPFEELITKYPRCKSALQWWCNAHEGHGKKPSSLNIAYIRGLKEFIIANPPTFRISNKCCHYAKKEPAKKYLKSHHFDVSCVGIRQAEGGVRATRYKTCFSDSQNGADQYRPLFWFTDADKKAYDEHYGVKHSDCYEVWGMKRTGCAGCPFNLKWKEELILAEKYEPKFHKAMMKVFAPSYAYRLKFEKFRKEMKAEITLQTTTHERKEVHYGSKTD